MHTHIESLVFCNRQTTSCAPIGSLLLQQDTNHVSHFNYGISLYILFKLKERGGGGRRRAYHICSVTIPLSISVLFAKPQLMASLCVFPRSN